MALVEAGPKSPDTPPARADTGAHDECRTVAADRGSRLPHGVPPLLGPGRPLPGDVDRRRRLGAGSGPPVLRRPRAQLWCLPEARAGRSPPGRGAATAVRRPRRRGRVRAAVDHRGATATREDWRELLAAAATLGATTVWVAFHGLGVEHDRQINRTGAFTETCLAVQRVHSVGCGPAPTCSSPRPTPRRPNGCWECCSGSRSTRCGGARRPTTQQPEAVATSGYARRCRSYCRWPAGSAPSAHSTTTSGRTWRPTPRRPGRVARWPATGHPGRATTARSWSWFAAPTSTCTPAHRRLVPPTARQPAHRRPPGGPRRRPPTRWAVPRGAVVRSRAAAVGCRAGRPPWRP
jgi:hypothetical protein